MAYMCHQHHTPKSFMHMCSGLSVRHMSAYSRLSQIFHGKMSTRLSAHSDCMLKLTSCCCSGCCAGGRSSSCRASCTDDTVNGMLRSPCNQLKRCKCHSSATAFVFRWEPRPFSATEQLRSMPAAAAALEAAEAADAGSTAGAGTAAGATVGMGTAMVLGMNAARGGGGGLGAGTRTVAEPHTSKRLSACHACCKILCGQAKFRLSQACP